MRKLGLFVASLALVAFVSSNAQAQSAKFAASWSDDVVFVKAAIADPATVPTCTDSGGGSGKGTEA